MSAWRRSRSLLCDDLSLSPLRKRSLWGLSIFRRAKDLATRRVSTLETLGSATRIREFVNSMVGNRLGEGGGYPLAAGLARLTLDV